MRRAVPALVALAIAASCGGATSHIFPGRRFDRARRCVDHFTSVDVLDGPDPGATCAVVCLLAPPTQTGEQTIYVTSECSPYPPLFDTSGADPDCARALDAYAHGPSCASDAGADAAGDAAQDSPGDAPADVSVDAGTDAPKDAPPEAQADAAADT